MGRVTLVALAVLALAASAGVADATTYRWVDANGVVHYSDTPPQIPAVTGDRDALIEEALELSGIKQQLAGLAPQVAANTDLSKSPLDAEEGAAVLQTLAAAFGLEPILATVRSVLRTGYDPQLMGVFVARLRTPTLRRLPAVGAPPPRSASPGSPAWPPRPAPRSTCSRSGAPSCARASAPSSRCCRPSGGRSRGPRAA